MGQLDGRALATCGCGQGVISQDGGALRPYCPKCGAPGKIVRRGVKARDLAMPIIARVGEEPWVAWPGVLPEPTAFSRLIDDAKLARALPYVVSDSKGVQVGQQCRVLGAFATHDLAAEFIGTLPEPETGRYNLDGPADDGPENWT